MENRTQGDIYIEARNRYLSGEITEAQLWEQYYYTGLLPEDMIRAIIADKEVEMADDAEEV